MRIISVGSLWGGILSLMGATEGVDCGLKGTEEVIGLFDNPCCRCPLKFLSNLLRGSHFHGLVRWLKGSLAIIEKRLVGRSGEKVRLNIKGWNGGNWEGSIVQKTCKCSLHCLDWTGLINE